MLSRFKALWRGCIVFCFTIWRIHDIFYLERATAHKVDASGCRLISSQREPPTLLADRVGIIFLACCSYYLNRQAKRSETFHPETIMLIPGMYPSASPPFFCTSASGTYKIRKVITNPVHGYSCLVFYQYLLQKAIEFSMCSVSNHKTIPCPILV